MFSENISPVTFDGSACLRIPFLGLAYRGSVLRSVVVPFLSLPKTSTDGGNPVYSFFRFQIMARINDGFASYKLCLSLASNARGHFFRF